MVRPASLLHLAPSLLVGASLLFVGGCDKSKKTEPPVVAPEPEPEPEPPKPSNEPSQTWEQQWATPSGKPTGSLVGIRNGHVYAVVGEYMEMGTPATHLVAFNEGDGSIAWTYAGKKIMTVMGASDLWIAASADEKPFNVAVKNGKKGKPKKGEADTITPFEIAPEPEGCTISGADINCTGWTATVTEAGTISGQVAFNDQACYAVANSREVRCRAISNGDLAFAVVVPAVEGVESPEAVNYRFMFANGKLYISNYDGTVLAFAQAGGGGGDDGAGEDPAAPAEEDITE
ncbi:MAG: hypothetical protein KC431_28235 [Myxococcales bacterium]|nr:hypothetical protein [Myxococcales bacterium]